MQSVLKSSNRKRKALTFLNVQEAGVFYIACPEACGLGGVALCEWSPAPSELLREPVNELPAHFDAVPHVLARKKLRAAFNLLGNNARFANSGSLRVGAHT